MTHSVFGGTLNLAQLTQSVHQTELHCATACWLLQLILTFMLTSIVVYLYTVLAFNFFRKFYVQEEEGEEPDSKCHDMLSVCEYIAHLQP